MMPLLLVSAILLASLATAADYPPPAHQEGLRIGDLQACRDTVSSAEAAPDEDLGMTSIILTLRPTERIALKKMTEALVGQALDVTLDGKIIMSSVVREPITGGQLSLVPVEDVELQRQILSAATRECIANKRLK